MIVRRKVCESVTTDEALYMLIVIFVQFRNLLMLRDAQAQQNLTEDYNALLLYFFLVLEQLKPKTFCQEIFQSVSNFIICFK